jgi:hypothetical protein
VSGKNEQPSAKTDVAKDLKKVSGKTGEAVKGGMNKNELVKSIAGKSKLKL